MIYNTKTAQDQVRTERKCPNLDPISSTWSQVVEHLDLSTSQSRQLPIDRVGENTRMLQINDVLMILGAWLGRINQDQGKLTEKK